MLPVGIVASSGLLVGNAGWQRPSTCPSPVSMALADGVLNVGIIGAGRIGIVHLEALASCATVWRRTLWLLHRDPASMPRARPRAPTSGDGRSLPLPLTAPDAFAIRQAAPLIISNPTVSKAKVGAAVSLGSGIFPWRSCLH